MGMLFHPLIVHFPVGLWLTSFFFDLLFARTRDRLFALTARYLIGLGVLSAGGAIALGYVDFIPLVAQGVGQAFVDVHRLHSKLAFASTGVYVGVFLARWRWRAMPMALYLGTALAGAVLISATGWFGGEIRRVM